MRQRQAPVSFVGALLYYFFHGTGRQTQLRATPGGHHQFAIHLIGGDLAAKNGTVAQIHHVAAVLLLLRQARRSGEQEEEQENESHVAE